MGSDYNQQAPTKKRPFCSKCTKPARVCLCSRLKAPPIDNSIGVTILQHSREKQHPLNSVRVAVLGLENLVVVPVMDITHRAEFVVRPLGCSDDAGVVGSEGACFDEVSRSGGSDGGIGRVDRNVKSKVGSLSNRGDVDLHFGKVLTLVTTDTTVNGGATDENCHIDGMDKGLGEDKGEVRNEPILLPVSQTRDLGEESCGKTRSPSENFDVKDDEGERSAREEKRLTTDSKCIVTYNPDHLLISMDKAAEPALGRARISPIGKAAAANGFVVKKFRIKQPSELPGTVEPEEFEIVVPPGSALLFPGKKSVCLDEVDFEVKHVIVLDGTWSKARRMYYENPWLQLVPLLRLDTEKASLYSEVRHQPKAGCLSTIESIVFALKDLGDEREEELDDLLHVFESMVLDQRRCKHKKFSSISRSRESCSSSHRS